MSAIERSATDHPGTNAPRRRKRLLVHALAFSVLVIGLATGTGTGVLPAGAESAPVSTPVTGTLTTKTSTFDLTGTVFQGTWDSATGALAGKFVFPETTVTVTKPVPATIGLQVRQPVDGTGTIDLVTNEATFNADLVLALLTLDAAGLGVGTIEPCNYAMPLALTGTYDPVTGFVDLSVPDFTVTAIDDANRCYWSSLGASVAASIDPEVVGSGNSFASSFDLGVADAAPPPPATTLPPTTTTTTVAVVGNQLPRTGSSSNLLLVVLALGLIDLGYLALTASQPGRRRRPSSSH